MQQGINFITPTDPNKPKLNRENFWFWESQVPKELCEKIIKDAEAIGFSDGKVGNIDTVNKKVRDCGIAWLPRMHIGECILGHHVNEANYSSNWHFDLSIVVDQLQIAKYSAQDSEDVDVGQFYGQHLDLNRFENYPHLERKMSAVLFLSDPNDFEGGDLKIMKSVIPKKQGTIVVFPSFMPHELTPVTKGTRYSAVCWVAGPIFK